MKHYVAIDLGAESGRVMVGAVGERMELREAHRFANVPVHVEGRLCWDVGALWLEIKAGLAKGGGGGGEGTAGGASILQCPGACGRPIVLGRGRIVAGDQGWPGEGGGGGTGDFW